MICGLLVLSAVIAGAQPETEVELRGGGSAVLTDVECSAAGLSGTLHGEPTVLTWDRVGRVRGEAAAQAEPFTDMAEQLWRGLSRLDRGDTVAAAPLLEEVFAELASEDGPTAGVAADGLALAMLRSGSPAAAVEPWLIRLQADAALVGRPVGRRVALDEQTRLIPELPPIFVKSPAIGAVAKSLSRDEFSRWGDGRDRRLAEFYATAAVLAAGGDPPGFPDMIDDDGARLVRAMVECRLSDPSRRAEARVTLRRVLQDTEAPWQRAWCHAGIGLSLLQESESERLAGIGHLLVLPARYGSTQGHLAGICLAQAAVALREAGRQDDAVLLIEELQIQYPRHPSLGLPSVRVLRSTGREAPANPTNGNRS